MVNATPQPSNFEQMFAGMALVPELVEMVRLQNRQIAALGEELAALRESRQKASKWLKLREAAEVLNTSPKTVRRYIDRGLLKRNSASRHILIPAEDVEGLRKKVVV